MQNSLDQFFLQIPEPQQSSLLFLRQFFVEEMKYEECWKFNTPFYYYKEKWFCYLSYSKKRKHEIYIGFVYGHKIEHKDLLSEGRKQIKVFRIDPNKDIDIKALTKICRLLHKHY